MALDDPIFQSAAAHRSWLADQSALPRGFHVGTATAEFIAEETGATAQSTLTLITLGEPSPSFAACFTQNAFPGAPVIFGRKRLDSKALSALVINNKISNVCAPQGVEKAEALCQAVGRALDVPPDSVIPSSTGIIGWRLPVQELISVVPEALTTAQTDSILPAAEGIMTTDLYPKVRRFDFPDGGSIVGIAKGAGMVEPNLATMLVYILSDVTIERDELRSGLRQAMINSFNSISIDSDQSTSDTVVCVSSNTLPAVGSQQFQRGLEHVCAELAEDVVRNGEGVRHVQRVTVSGAPDSACARAIGKAIINSPLWKTALAGNDPNVGRLVMALGKEMGNNFPELTADHVHISINDITVCKNAQFTLNPHIEEQLAQLFTNNQLYTTKPAEDGITFTPPVSYPPHPRIIPIHIELGQGSAQASVIGGDLTHEYVTENADYRS